MTPSPTSKPIRIALVGAGIYMRDAHLPALLAAPDRFEIVATWSRSLEAATTLASSVPGNVQPVTDFQALLARNDIEAYNIALPIPVQAGYVAQALASGRHVISEKPLAPTGHEAAELLAIHRRQPGQVWMVGENWRYEEAYVRAAALVAGDAIGQPVSMHWAHYVPMNPASKYYVTEWRRSGAYQGGLLMDGGVHYVAAVRSVLGEIDGVAAFAALNAPDLPPLDTLTATLHFANGTLGTLLMNFAVGTPLGAPLTVVGETGSLRVERGRIEVARPGAVEVIECASYNGVANELLAFADAIRTGVGHRNTPQEAMGDLAVVEALLRSAVSGRVEHPSRDTV